jgi:ATP adenylyltransferase
MERLWAPWRLAYVTSAGSSAECIFCDALRHEESASLIVHRGATCYVILNLFPYNNGHLMVVPNRHVARLADALPDELAELMALTRLSEMALAETYDPQGINVGVNLGKAAGAGVLDHLHVHLVPRWSGDTNFMTVVSEVRVLPEDLEASVRRLRPVFARLAAEQ